jgi:hypothetical protein
MSRTVRLLFLLMAMAPTWAMAGEPTGLDDLAFGTPREALVAEPGFRAHCHPSPEVQTAARSQAWRVTCPTYDVKDLGAMRVALLFAAEDRLTGYVMYIPRARQDEVRAKIESVYGPPTSQMEQGRTDLWQWPSGTEASLTFACRGSDGCLTVKAKPPGPTPAAIKAAPSR